MSHPLPLLMILVGIPLIGGCNALGGSENLRGGTEATFEFVAGVPADGAPTAPVTATIILTFSSEIDPASVTSNTLGIDPATFGTLTVGGPTLTFDPADDLLPSTTYVFTISPELKGENGAALGAMLGPYGFKTAGGPPPDTLPTNGPRPR